MQDGAASARIARRERIKRVLPAGRIRRGAVDLVDKLKNRLWVTHRCGIPQGLIWQPWHEKT